MNGIVVEACGGPAAGGRRALSEKCLATNLDNPSLYSWQQWRSCMKISEHAKLDLELEPNEEDSALPVLST